MTTAALLTALLTYGPTFLPLLQRLVADIEAGRGNKTVTSEDLAELAALMTETGEDIYRREGIALPPAAPAPAVVPAPASGG